MGGIEIQLSDWDRLKEELLKKIDERMAIVATLDDRVTDLECDHDNCSTETNWRLAKIENILNQGRNLVTRILSKGFVVAYRGVALYLLYRIATANPELATYFGELLK